MRATKTVAALALGLGLPFATPASADDELLRGRFAGAFTGAAPPNAIALFEGVFRVDDDRYRLDGASFAGSFPDGSPCFSPLGLCSVWTTDEGELFNQTDAFTPAPDGSFSQVLTFVGGTGEFDGANGTGFVKGTLDGAGGFEGRFKGILSEGEDDDDDDYEDDDD